jgi:hypothetical protein
MMATNSPLNRWCRLTPRKAWTSNLSHRIYLGHLFNRNHYLFSYSLGRAKTTAFGGRIVVGVAIITCPSVKPVGDFGLNAVTKTRGDIDF